MNDAHKGALAAAIKKFDTPKRERPKSCDGTRESERELAKRLNWLRERAE